MVLSTDENYPENLPMPLLYFGISKDATKKTPIFSSFPYQHNRSGRTT